MTGIANEIRCVSSTTTANESENGNRNRGRGTTSSGTYLAKELRECDLWEKLNLFDNFKLFIM